MYCRGELVASERLGVALALLPLMLKTKTILERSAMTGFTAQLR